MSETEILAPTDAGLAGAAQLLSAGALVAFPTETVYGLGADAGNGRAVAEVFAAKGRPAFNPLIVHVADLAAARRLAVFDATAERLAAAFWPGPLTLVLPRRAGAPLSELVTAGLPTVALRVPDHPVAQGVLAAFGGALAGPSANPSGRVSPTTAAHVLDGLAGRIAAVVDGGPCPVGVESTIVGLTGGGPRLLRPGGLPAETLEACLGAPLLPASALPPSEAAASGHPSSPRPAPVRPPAGVPSPEAPGMLASHYAPRARLRLGCDGPRPGEVWLHFGPGPAPQGARAVLSLSATGDLTEAAARLFALLHEADALAGPEGIAAAPLPEHGLGLAINDRLRRAAAPRE